MTKIKNIEKKEPKKSDYHSAMKDVGPYLNLGIQMIIPVIGGVFLGVWLDGEYSTKPMWTVIMALIGIAIGMYGFFKVVLNIKKKK